MMFGMRCPNLKTKSNERSRRSLKALKRKRAHYPEFSSKGYQKKTGIQIARIDPNLKSKINLHLDLLRRKRVGVVGAASGISTNLSDLSVRPSVLVESHPSQNEGWGTRPSTAAMRRHSALSRKARSIC